MSRRYRPIRELGRGGAGRVHLAFDLELRRCVALKQRRGRPDPDERDPLRAEALALARVCDPRVVSLYDYGVQGDSHFLAMEYVPGVTLGAWQAQARRPRAQLLRLYIAAGHALTAVHRAGLVHRDFKPDNVMVGPDEAIKLVDLGLAVPLGEARGPRGLTTAGPGTPLFIAPEQLLGEPVDERADQFSFCVALYRAFYGAHPFAPRPTWPDPASGTELNALFCRLTAAPPRVPPGHADDSAWPLLQRGLARAPSARHRSLPELLRRLAALSERPARRRPPPGPARSARACAAYASRCASPAPALRAGAE